MLATDTLSRGVRIGYGSGSVATGARFTATPVAVRGMGTFPVRAFASLD